MPHSVPRVTENLTGWPRVVRAAVVPAMEMSLWAERDNFDRRSKGASARHSLHPLDFALALCGVSTNCWSTPSGCRPT